MPKTATLFKSDLAPVGEHFRNLLPFGYFPLEKPSAEMLPKESRVLSLGFLFRSVLLRFGAGRSRKCIDHATISVL